MAANKNDTHARDCWGEVYDAMPKSVFATVAYHLAERLGGGDETAAKVFMEEAMTLAQNQIIPVRQLKRAATSN